MTLEHHKGSDLEPLHKIAEAKLHPYGLKLRGIHVFPMQPCQRQRQGIGLQFEVTTHNPHLLGLPYTNASRIELIHKAYEIFGNEVFNNFPGQDVLLDMYPILEEPYVVESPMGEYQAKTGHVDVTKDNEVVFEDIDTLRRNGTIQEGSDMDRYCRKYGLPHVLRHGRHYISPDILTVEALEALMKNANVRSVLEIGAGVGITGVAAERAGIRDMTFLDLNPDVCKYVRGRFPQYSVVESDLFDYPFDREWDLVLVGVPYELQPHFFEKRGQDLAQSARTVVLQSGIPSFFQFEHDWVMGKKHFEKWPWWRREQTAGAHFPHVAQVQANWQLGVVASHEDMSGKLGNPEAIVPVKEYEEGLFLPSSLVAGTIEQKQSRTRSAVSNVHG